MRQLKRFLVFIAEIGVLMLGLFGSGAVATVVAISLGPDAGVPFLCIYCLGLLLTMGAFLRIRRKNKPRKIAYDAEVYCLQKSERKLHPVRARYKQAFFRSVVWLPSLIAAIVIFFFPLVSHLGCPRSRFLRHYRIPIPWTTLSCHGPGWHSETTGWTSL
jgi:hypothetical protein